MKYELANLVVSIISLSFVFFGGCFTLYQYRKSMIYRRIEMVRTLINDIMLITPKSGDPVLL